MSVAEFLQAYNRKREQERQARSQETPAQSQFRQEAAEAFAQVVEPAVADLMRVFRENGVEAQMGQHFDHVSFRSASEKISFTVYGEEECIQFDILGNCETSTIDVTYRNSLELSIRQINRLRLPDLTREKVEELVQKGLSTIFHC
jgi:hypothetical protein